MLKQHLEDIRLGLAQKRFPNEASVSMGIVLRLLNGLGWPTYDTRVVAPEYGVEGRRVDFALCHPADRPLVFIEVKQVGQAGGAERQLFEYAFHRGVPLAILTDGNDWHFFLPGEAGAYAERRLYRLDITEHNSEESIRRLERYLQFDAVCSGKALVDARADYEGVEKKRRVRETLPTAWATVIEEEDEFVVLAIAERVERLCGYKPDADAVMDFLR